jgi:hypothetical protein
MPSMRGISMSSTIIGPARVHGRKGGHRIRGNAHTSIRVLAQQRCHHLPNHGRVVNQ